MAATEFGQPEFETEMNKARPQPRLVFPEA
jgi:hypothetical protein